MFPPNQPPPRFRHPESYNPGGMPSVRHCVQYPPMEDISPPGVNSPPIYSALSSYGNPMCVPPPIMSAPPPRYLVESHSSSYHPDAYPGSQNPHGYSHVTYTSAAFASEYVPQYPPPSCVDPPRFESRPQYDGWQHTDQAYKSVEFPTSINCRDYTSYERDRYSKSDYEGDRSPNEVYRSRYPVYEERSCDSECRDVLTRDDRLRQDYLSDCSRMRAKLSRSRSPSLAISRYQEARMSNRERGRSPSLDIRQYEEARKSRQDGRMASPTLTIRQHVEERKLRNERKRSPSLAIRQHEKERKLNKDDRKRSPSSLTSQRDKTRNSRNEERKRSPSLAVSQHEKSRKNHKEDRRRSRKDEDFDSNTTRKKGSSPANDKQRSSDKERERSTTSNNDVLRSERTNEKQSKRRGRPADVAKQVRADVLPSADGGSKRRRTKSPDNVPSHLLVSTSTVLLDGSGLLPLVDTFDDEKWRLMKETQRKNSERASVLEKYRKNFCANSDDIHERLEELNQMEPEDIMEQEMKVWTRTSPSELYYKRDEENMKITRSTNKLLALCERFQDELVNRAEKVRAGRPKFELPPRKNRAKLARHKSEACCHSSSSSSDDSSTDEEDITMQELERKKLHPNRLHEEMWFNDTGEMNDGPLCRCSAKAKRCGIRHGIYAGEDHLFKCDVDSNNGDRLYHYRITISPPTNFLTKTPTMINHDEHEFIFEGFSMFSHFPLVKLPTCKVIRFNIEYTILYIEEKLPDNFTIRELDLFHDYLFREILELIDLDFKAHEDSSGCSQFHFMPRFVRELPDNGKEILSMNEVLVYLLDNSHELIKQSQLEELLDMMQYQWQNFADEVKGMVVTYPGMKPCSVRVDQLDRNQENRLNGVIEWPEIVHFGIRPPQLSYAGNPEYQKAWREYVKFRHLVANMSKPSFEDKRKLEAKENRLKEMRTQSKMKRDVTVAVASRGFHRTGIMCDVVQHAMLIPVLVCHLRFHRSCDVLEQTIGHRFENRYLLQLALTHPSYRENFGTNPDHARNSLTNCGIRQPEYGDRRIHYMNTRKRGINTLINIMSRFGKRTETESNITHNERLEFLGDAVVEFLTSIHLFHIFPDLEEGGLATYRAAIVQNQHLAVLAKRLHLEQYMLYAHGSDLCHDLELRHAMANCFEALMGALFLDATIDVADKVFGETLHMEEPDLLDVWVQYPPHPLQEQEPLGDRKWIPKFELLQKLTKFEESIGVEFKHIRLLARAFTDRSIGYTNLTLGSNQRLEFLGDTVLQLIASEYLYKFFPEHHEGHLSLLRSSLVNNRTQAVVCDDLGMTAFALYANPKVELKTKDRADLLEAFLGALYVDKDLDFCHVFCHVCFFPRLQDFIMNQDWNDPKSKLQQCCLTLRTMDGGEPDIPIYKVIECKGPTNTRVYTVAVYFQGKRLAASSGHSIQQAEMNAAKTALELSQGKNLFPQLDHQKRVIAKSMKKQKWPKRSILRGRTSKLAHEEEAEECREPSEESAREKSRSHSKSRTSSRSRTSSISRQRSETRAHSKSRIRTKSGTSSKSRTESISRVSSPRVSSTSRVSLKSRAESSPRVSSTSRVGLKSRAESSPRVSSNSSAKSNSRVSSKSRPESKPHVSSKSRATTMSRTSSKSEVDANSRESSQLRTRSKLRSNSKSRARSKSKTSCRSMNHTASSARRPRTRTKSRSDFKAPSPKSKEGAPSPESKEEAPSSNSGEDFKAPSPKSNEEAQSPESKEEAPSSNSGKHFKAPIPSSGEDLSTLTLKSKEYLNDAMPERDSSTPGPERQGDSSTPRPEREGDSSTPGPEREGDLSTRGPQREEDSSTPGPQREGDSSTPGPERQGDSSTPRPEREGDLSTPGPEREEDSSTLRPEREGDSSTPGPERQGDSSTPRPEREGDSSTPGPEREGDSSTPGLEHEGDSSTPGPEREGDSSTPGPEREGDSSTPGPEREGDASTPGPEREGDSSTPRLEREGDSSTPKPEREGDSTGPSVESVEDLRNTTLESREDFRAPGRVPTLVIQPTINSTDLASEEQCKVLR